MTDFSKLERKIGKLLGHIALISVLFPALVLFPKMFPLFQAEEAEEKLFFRLMEEKSLSRAEIGEKRIYVWTAEGEVYRFEKAELPAVKEQLFAAKVPFTEDLGKAELAFYRKASSVSGCILFLYLLFILLSALEDRESGESLFEQLLQYGCRKFGRNT